MNKSCPCCNRPFDDLEAKYGGWIPVSERLPIDEGKVLLCFGEPFFGEFSPEVEAGYYDEESKKFLFWMNDRDVRGSGVTHWMPLPSIEGLEK